MSKDTSGIKNNYEKLSSLWEPYSWMLVPPETEEELERLMGFADYLIDETGNDERHLLSGLLHIVGALIQEYEDRNLPEPPSDPIGCLLYLMEEHGLKQKDLTEIGSPGVISEVLSGKRKLNIRQVAGLAKRFGCSPAVFI